jgi:hypothetical protein
MERGLRNIRELSSPEIKGAHKHKMMYGVRDLLRAFARFVQISAVE